MASRVMLLLSAIASQAFAQWPQRLEELELKGLEGTRRHVVERELPWKPGERVTQAQWDLGVARLWNTGLFSRLDARVELRDGRAVAVFELEEVFSLNPLFSFGVGGGVAWVRVGANDINFLGRFLEWGARYERFGAFNGGQAWVRDPRLFGWRLDAILQAEFLFRPRPLYIRRRMSLMSEVLGDVTPVVRAGVRVDGYRDEYSAPVSGEAAVPGAQQVLTVTPSLKLGRVDLERLRQKGVSLEVRPAFSLSSDSGSPRFAQLFVELLAFRLIGHRTNLAVRAQAGVTTTAPMENGFYLGGLDLVRGYPDSHVRAEAFMLTNAEVRVTFFDTTWVAGVAALFVDGAIARTAAGENMQLLSVGGGVRIVSPKLVKTGLRGDLAVTLIGRPQLGYSLGVYQFF